MTTRSYAERDERRPDHGVVGTHEILRLEDQPDGSVPETVGGDPRGEVQGSARCRCAEIGTVASTGSSTEPPVTDDDGWVQAGTP